MTVLQVMSVQNTQSILLPVLGQHKSIAAVLALLRVYASIATALGSFCL